MLMSKKVLLALVAFAFSVHAQDESDTGSVSATDSATDTASSAVPTSTDGIPPCVLQCSTEAASSAGCQGVTDTACVCTSADFQNAAAQCLQQSCSAEEQQAGLALQSQVCAGASSVSASGSATSPPASSATSGSASRPSSSASSTASGSAASQTESDNAAASVRPVTLGGNLVVGLSVAFVGMAVGAGLVL